ncbi:MAG: hypothetical protein IPK14_06595 [Blastocatellia bacterium]|nr:hypothetical protein [Blastocatellia bacterium]MBL8196897.1 hypothetical protein [Blastocatellia bacterium]MBN8722808.1 hypothetical protein [Acidobacteriota bacterium]
MFKAFLSLLVLLLLSIQIQAQTKKSAELLTYDLTKGVVDKDKINPLQDEGPVFISPQNSIIKLQRQVELRLLPQGFVPALETELDSSRRQLLRYGFAYYRDNEIPGFGDFRDIIVPIRLDSTNGFLDIKFYRRILIVPPAFDFPEDRTSLAVLPQDEGSALLLFLEGTTRKFLLSLNRLFDDPQMINFLAFDEVQSIQSDQEFKKFIIFTRGSSDRSSLFVSVTDPTLTPISQGVELAKDLPIDNQVYIFKIFPGTEPQFRGAAVPPKNPIPTKTKED